MKIAMIFPGYGSQFVGMGKELYDTSRIMQEYFEEAAHCLDINFVKLCFAASDIELGRMENAYPALFLLSCSLAAILKNEGISPDIVAGYDMGQLAAIHAVGGINFPDGLYLLSKYASFYQEYLSTMTAGALRVQGATARVINDVCRTVSSGDGSIARIAVYDPYDGYMVAGHMEAVDRVREVLLKREGVTITDADLELGLHSELMQGVAAGLRIYSEKVDFKSSEVPVVASADGKLVLEGDMLKECTLNSIDNPIMWEKVLKQLEPYDILVEIGPGSRLLKHLMQQYPEKQCLAINKQQDIDTLKTIIGSPATDIEG